jgi:hypothetical protein
MGVQESGVEVLVTGLLLEGSGIGRQGISPHPIQVLAQGGQAGRIELIHASPSNRPSLDEPGTPKHGQMLRNSRLRDTQMPHELADGVGPRPQAFDQSAPGRISQRGDG